ncbi:MAG: hypothetical protein OXQ29_19150 [Rhodospirillaceae bacterium]|nr:hypothetical protein [Rhodospirillaceae bacterium]
MFCIRHIIGKAVIAAFLTRALAEERLHRHEPVFITPDGTKIPVSQLEIVFDPHFGVD